VVKCTLRLTGAEAVAGAAIQLTVALAEVEVLENGEKVL
jgi:hypothetical protein